MPEQYSYQHLLSLQLKTLGEKIEQRYDGHIEYSAPVSPLQNLYLPHLLPLVQVKLRIGHAMARLTHDELKDRCCELYTQNVQITDFAMDSSFLHLKKIQVLGY